MNNKRQIKVLRVLWYGLMLVLWEVNFIYAAVNDIVWVITFILFVLMGGITYIINLEDRHDSKYQD